MGQFKILAKIGGSAYKLDLPATIRIYKTSHISLLKPYNNDKFLSQYTRPPPAISMDGEPKYKLKYITAW